MRARHKDLVAMPGHIVARVAPLKRQAPAENAFSREEQSGFSLSFSLSFFRQGCDAGVAPYIALSLSL